MHWAFLHHLSCQITPNCTCVLDPPCPQFEMTAREIEAFRATRGTDVSLLSEHTSPKHKKKKQVLPMNATMKITAGDETRFVHHEKLAPASSGADRRLSPAETQRTRGARATIQPHSFTLRDSRLPAE